MKDYIDPPKINSFRVFRGTHELVSLPVEELLEQKGFSEEVSPDLNEFKRAMASEYVPFVEVPLPPIEKIIGSNEPRQGTTISGVIALGIIVLVLGLIVVSVDKNQEYQQSLVPRSTSDYSTYHRVMQSELNADMSNGLIASDVTNCTDQNKDSPADTPSQTLVQCDFTATDTNSGSSQDISYAANFMVYSNYTVQLIWWG